MAIDDVQGFLQALEQDEELAVRADDAYVEALHRVASESGYGFSEDDLRAALDAAAADLSDAELDDVVGGATRSMQTSPSLSSPTLVAPSSTGDTVYGGTSSLVGMPSLTRFSSFSKSGFSR